MKKETFDFNKYNQMYKKQNYKRVPLDLQIDYYDKILKPHCAAAGIPINTFIKQAIKEKLQRDAGQVPNV